MASASRAASTLQREDVEAALRRSGSNLVADLSHSQPKSSSTSLLAPAVKWDAIADSAFDSCPDLRDINLSFHAFSRLDGLSRLLELRRLFAHNCRISSMAPLSRLRKLEDLNLARNDLNHVDATVMDNFKLLRTLRLDSNAIVNVEARALDKNFSLEELDLSCNNLNTLPGFRLKKLTTLRVARNAIATVSPDLSTGCPALTDLNLEHNALTSTSLAAAGLHNLNRLTSLNLNCNSIGPHVGTAFPVALPALLELFLDGNKLESLDGFADRFPSLQVLHVAHNAIDATVARRHGASVAVMAASSWRSVFQPLKSLRLLELRVEGNACLLSVGREEACAVLCGLLPSLEVLDDVPIAGRGTTPAAAGEVKLDEDDEALGEGGRASTAGVTPNLMLKSRPATASRRPEGVDATVGLDRLLQPLLSEVEVEAKAAAARDMLAATRRSVGARIHAAGGAAAPAAAVRARAAAASVAASTRSSAAGEAPAAGAATAAATVALPARPSTSAGRPAAASATASSSSAGGGDAPLRAIAAAGVRPASSRGRALAQALEYSRLQSDGDAGGVAAGATTVPDADDEDDYDEAYAPSPSRAAAATDVTTALRPMSAKPFTVRPASARPGTRGGDARISTVDADAIAVAALPDTVAAAREGNPTVRAASGRPASARPASARVGGRQPGPASGPAAEVADAARRPFVIQTAALRTMKRAGVDGDAAVPRPAAKSPTPVVPAEPLAKWSQHDLDAALANIGGGGSYM